jgi:lipopolysaccharide transport system ATP-binding protein
MLYKDIQSWWARVRGKEDPNSVIGMYNKEQLDEEDRFWALKDVSFKVQQGDRIGILGRNGAGKSTLLKVLSRITYPTTGYLGLKGKVVSLLEVGTGFHQELSGRENIYLNGAILGMSKADINRRFDEIVDFSGIEQFRDTPVKRYSSGMYVRLAFAVAAHLEADIMIVDEVLAVGDVEFQKKCIGKMSEVGKDGRTVLFVSHNIGAISSLCNRGLFLQQGQTKGICGLNEAIESYIGDIAKYKIFFQNRVVKWARAAQNDEVLEIEVGF